MNLFRYKNGFNGLLPANAIAKTGIPLFVTGIVSALVLILTGVITEKQAYATIDMRTIFLTVGMMPMDSALNSTGAGKMIADVVLLGTNATFCTPIAMTPNTMVYGYGEYKFTDYVRVGLPMEIIYFVGTMILAPVFWPFY